MSESVSGINSTDGKITLALGILGVVLGLVAMARAGGARKGLGIGLLLAGLVVGGLGIYNFTQVSNFGDNAADECRSGVSAQLGAIPPEQQAQMDDLINQMIEKLDISTGTGLYLAIGGGILLLIGGHHDHDGHRFGRAAPADSGGGAFAPPAPGGMTPPPPAPPADTPPATPPPAPPAGGAPPS